MIGSVEAMSSANLGCRSYMLFDAAPNGANCGWVTGGYKDFAPPELIRESIFVFWDQNAGLGLQRRNRMAPLEIVHLGRAVTRSREPLLTMRFGRRERCKEQR